MVCRVFRTPGPHYVAWVFAPVHDLTVIAHGSRKEMKKTVIKRYRKCEWLFEVDENQMTAW